MMTLKKSLSVYFLSTLIEKGIAFLIIPLLTAKIAPAGIGKLSLITSIYAFLTPLILLNTGGAIYVEHFRNDNKAHYKRYFSTALFINFLAFIFFSLIALLGMNYFAGIINCPPYWIMALPLFCFFDALKMSVLNVLQIQKKPLYFSLVSLSASILNFSLSLLFVYRFGLDYMGRLSGIFISSLVIAAIAFFLFFKFDLITKKISKVFAKDILNYGLPLLPHAFGYLVLDVSDRFFIRHFSGDAALGIYSISYLVSSVVFILASVFNTSWTPFLYDELKNNNRGGDLKIVKITWKFIFAMLLFCLVYLLFIPVLYRLFINEQYYPGIQYCLPIVTGYFFMTVYLAFANVIFYYKKNHIFGLVAIINISLNLVLNYFLVKWYGPFGAAIATCISMFLFMATIAFYSNRVRPLPWAEGFRLFVSDVKKGKFI